MVLKPSELAPVSACLFAEILDAAGVPAGVFNLVNGDGPTVGQAIASHPDVAMVSFTGSTRAGVEVAIAAAPTVKRVTQELGGKSANILLDDVDLQVAVTHGVQACFRNAGQSCNAPTRMLVQRRMLPDAAAIARTEALATKVGDPFIEGITMGPLISTRQFERVEGYIRKGIEEGATLIAGGLGRPSGLAKGHFVKPTVFSNVTSEMTIAREEIFGPVLSMIAYEDDEDAVRIANDTLSGLSGYVSSASTDRARSVAKRIRSGNVHINGARPDFAGSFGGFKQSGNGREWGKAGLEEYLELKAIFGFAAK
jgi:aldehyde dehydrogenase (NAD+)